MIFEERQKKLELEDKLKKMGKENVELQKKSSDLEKQKNRIEQEERMIEEEIRLFQREKMKRLNKMEQSFVLRLSQLQNLELDQRPEKKEKNEQIQALRQKENEMNKDNEGDKNEGSEGNRSPTMEHMQKMEERKDCIGYILPADLHDSLLITEDEIIGLLKTKEKHKAKLKEEEDNQKSKKIENDKKEKQIKVKEKEKKKSKQLYEDELQLKFGQLIKLDDDIPWNANTENIKKKEVEYSKVEDAQNARIRAAETELEMKKRQLNEQVMKNTGLLNHIQTLGERGTALEKELVNSNNQIFV